MVTIHSREIIPQMSLISCQGRVRNTVFPTLHSLGSGGTGEEEVGKLSGTWTTQYSRGCHWVLTRALFPMHACVGEAYLSAQYRDDGGWICPLPMNPKPELSPKCATCTWAPGPSPYIEDHVFDPPNLEQLRIVRSRATTCPVSLNIQCYVCVTV